MNARPQMTDHPVVAKVELEVRSRPARVRSPLTDASGVTTNHKGGSNVS